MSWLRSAVALLLLGAANGDHSPQPIDVECDIEHFAKDYYDRPAEHDLICHTPTEDLDLDASAVAGFSPLTGDKAVVRGIRRGRRGLRINNFTWKSRRFGRGQHDGKGTKGKRRLQEHVGLRTAVVVILRFVDGNGNLIPSIMDTAAERKDVAATVNRTVFGVFDSSVQKTLAGAWKECSWGQLGLDFNVDGVNNDFARDFPGHGEGADIFYADVPMKCDTSIDPFCGRDYDSANNCGNAEYKGWVLYALNKYGIVKQTWQHMVIIVPTDIIKCSFVGMGSVGCSAQYCTTFIPVKFADKVANYVHELGHNLGLAHAGQLGGSNYGDYSCPMGFCCSVRCYNAPHAWELGWMVPSLELDGGNLRSGQAISGVVLKSMSMHSDAVVSITTDWTDTPLVYWLQLKTAHSYDQYMNAAWRNNVQIKLWNKGSYEKPMHLSKLVAGDSWTDPLEDLTVTVDSIDVTSSMTATVTISRRAIDMCAGVVCAPLDDCHYAGVCDPTTGQCSNPLKLDCCGNGKCEAGESCSDCIADCGACPSTTSMAPTTTASKCGARRTPCQRHSQCCSNRCWIRKGICF